MGPTATQLAGHSNGLSQVMDATTESETKENNSWCFYFPNTGIGVKVLDLQELFWVRPKCLSAKISRDEV